jgi:hypothetical protein
MIDRRQWILLAGASGATLTLGKLSTALAASDAAKVHQASTTR